MDIKSENLPILKVNEFIETMKPIYRDFLSNKKYRLPVLMLWGPPGVGKSDAIEEIAIDLGEQTGKKIHITDVRLLLYNPVDLRGIPTADEKKEFCKWLKPKIFQMDPSEEVVNFLVLDEITAAPQSVQAAAYQIVLNRQIEEHKLPDNCIIICAGNRITDRSVAYSMSKALSNRLTHVIIDTSVEDWKKWALKSGIDPRIIGFLNYKPSALMVFDPSSQDNAFPTPRTWEMVSNYLNINGNIDIMKPMISGTIGAGPAIEFITFCKTFNKIPDVRAIADGLYNNYPNSPDVYYALQSAIVNFCITTKITPKQIKNILKYCYDMEPEFAILTLKDLVNTSLAQKICKTQEWIDFSKKYNDYL